jgi:hypothetical protein
MCCVEDLKYSSTQLQSSLIVQKYEVHLKANQVGLEMNATTGNIFIETCYILKENINVVIKFPSTSSVVLYVIAIVVNVSLVFTTLFLNGVTVATIWNSRTLKERVSNNTILIQSIIDLANGLIVSPLLAMHLVRNLIGNTSCTTAFITRKIGYLLCFYSMTTMSAMTFERYMGVLHPFVHRVKVTKSRVLKYIISVCCIQTLVFSVTFFNGVQITRPFFTTYTLLFLAFTAFAYSRIFCFRIKNMSRSPLGKQVVNVAERTNGSTKARLLKELKIAKSCFLVVVTSLVCSLPSLILNGFINLETNFLLDTLQKWAYLLILFNSTANSLIFFWRNKALRTEGMNRIKVIRDSLSRICADV